MCVVSFTSFEKFLLVHSVLYCLHVAFCQCPYQLYRVWETYFQSTHLPSPRIQLIFIYHRDFASSILNSRKHLVTGQSYNNFKKQRVDYKLYFFTPTILNVLGNQNILQILIIILYDSSKKLAQSSFPSTVFFTVLIIYYHENHLQDINVYTSKLTKKLLVVLIIHTPLS